ncbi:MAG: hypothetical protein ACOC38_12485, partial [Promethearchaeia archaeon]
MRNRKKLMIFSAILVPLLIFSSANSVLGGTVGGESMVDAVILFKPGVDVNLQNVEIAHRYDELNGVAARMPL